MNSVVRAVSIETEVTASDFRSAMRQLTGGVSVITAGRGRDISGMTVTSVSSLSVDPPALIVSINREASSWPLVKRYGFFGVNILTSDQIDIAERFTGKGGLKGADRFAGAPMDDARLRRAAAGRTRWRRSIARSRMSSSGIRMRSSSAACWMLRCRRAPRRWPIGRGAMSPSIRTRMRRSLPRSACRRGHTARKF